MLAILTVIAPIFALMAFGYSAVRFRLFPAEGIKSLIAFVNNFATPCLLFHSLLSSDFSSAFNLGIIGPFYLGAAICFAIGIVIALKLFGNTPGVAVSVGFSGTFTNTVLVGLPIMTRAYGADSLPVTLSIIGLHGAILLSLGMVTMELMRRDGQSLGQTLLTAARRVGSNPLIKLIVHPAIAYVLMIWVLHVPMDIARYGILLAAMPAGVNVYVFATYYNRATNVAANTILIATVASAATISGWL